MNIRFVTDFKNLLQTSDFIFLYEMGFSSNWEKEEI